MTPVEALLTVAKSFLGTKESPVGSNRGVQIDYWLTRTKAPLAQPWCAAFVHACGREAVGLAWPVLQSASVQTIVDWAKREGRFQAAPKVGDCYVVHYPALGRYGHIGIVESVAADKQTFVGISGNTNDAGSREGYTVARKTVPLTDRIRFIRWTD